MSRIIIVTGPPGAGKTTLARRMATDSHAGKAVHLHTDDFYSAIKAGFIAPWLPESNAQNTTITHAICAAACAYARDGYEVFLDGIVGLWFLQIYKDQCAQESIALHYVFLHPDQDVAVIRARDRADSPLLDYPPRLYDQLTDLGAMNSHAIKTDGLSVEDTIHLVRDGLSANRFAVTP